MGRKETRRRNFSAHIERLEVRQVMTADPLGRSPGVEHHDVDAQASALDQHPISPDFWIDPAQQTSLTADFLQEVEQALTEAHNQTGWFNVRTNYGFTGRGQTVAVIDSGIAYNHFALGGGLGANYRVVGGWDFTEENDANPYDDGASGGHGTHVSGIIGSNSGTHTGVAPGVDLVSLRVFNDTGAGYFSWVENALRWVHQHRNDYENPITAINLSLGVSTWNAATAPAWANLEDEFAQLEADGIFISVSAGNSFTSYNQPGLSYPAASQYVVPVMATDDSGSLSYFSQRLARAIAAPGRNIVSTIPDYKGNNNSVADDFAAMSGTSMAAPYVAGASTLVRQAMEFVGRTNITQDMIYDHMLATADVVFDAVTNLSYKRLDLQAAIDALMPTDDFGSTIGSAHELGSLAGGREVTGTIGRLNDQDYFRFTAASTGRVTFETTSLRDDMTPSWQVYGSSSQSLAAANAGEVAFDVVAGQTYSVRLSSTGGLGHYTFDVSATSSFSFQEWGAVAFNQVADVAVAGEQWYRVQATQAGYLTVQGLFNAAGGNVNVELYDASLQLVAAGNTASGRARVDAQAAAGAQYFVRVAGANGNVDFTLLNLVQQNDSVVTAVGTAGDDAFAFSAGSASTLTVNGVSYTFAAGSASQFHIDGGGGYDSVTLTGTTGVDAATLRFGSATLNGAGYSAAATNVEMITIYGGGGADEASIYDSAGDDFYRTYANRVEMSGQGGSLAAWNFAKTTAFATTGNDEVRSYDSAGADTYRTFANRVVMAGAGYANEARGFDTTYGYSSTGIDRVYSYDTTGDDLYRTWSDRVVMSGAGYYNFAQGFEYAYGYASTGNDAAYSYDSAGDDLYRAWRDRVIMSGAGYYNFSQGFDRTYAYGTTGNDTSYSYDSAGDDMLRAWANRAVLSGDGFYNYVQDFDKIYTYATGGFDRAYLYDSAGDDLFRAWSNRAVMSGAGYYSYAQDFDNIYGYATTGNDVANLYDSAGDDLYRAWDNRVVMSGVGYYNYAQGFDRTIATTSTGNDQAVLYDSPLDDVLTIRTWGATLAGVAYWNEVRGFDSLIASGSGGANSKDVASVDYLFSLIGNWS